MNPTTPSTPAPHCVLLVDDDPTQLKLNRLRLEEIGFSVQTARSATEALAELRQRTPDVIMSDVIMGEIDGFALCRRVREQPSLAAVPVILLSAHYDGERDREVARELGATSLVMRTPDFSAELAALRAALVGDAQPATPERQDRTYERLLRSTARQMSKLVDRVARSEERYRTLLQSANDAITLLTPDGVILEANERWRSVLGIEPKEMVGRHIREFAAPGDERASLDEYREDIARGAGSSGPIAIRHANGHVVLMQFSVTVSVVAGETMVLSIGRDVTEEVAAHQALVAAERKYRTLVERIPDVMWTTTEDGTMTFMTRNVSNVFGYPQEEMQSETLVDRMQSVHPGDQEFVLRAFEALCKDGTPFDIEYRQRHQDGHWIWVRNRAIGAYEHNGKRYFDGLLSDVTDRKRLEESFRHAQKLEAIGQLTGGIAHDFNNVLAAILANSHFLIEALAEHDPRRADAEEIKVAAERAAGLTRQLLAFSSKQVLEPRTVSLDGIVAGTERMLRRLIGEDIELSVTCGPSLGNVRVDVGQIEQVIMNLAVNARDAMPHGGKVAIVTSELDLRDAKAAAEVGAHPGRYVRITFTDNGSGMSAETKSRVFEPFFTTKGLGKGTGLGLSTCYGIVQQSGGFISVESEPGSGTEFAVHLPRVEAAEERAQPRPAQLDLDGSETVLLIEDDTRVRTAVRRMLERRGYRLLMASDGADALALASACEEPIDLIVSDVVMPGGSGPEIVKRIREQNGDIRALFMSGYTDHAALPSDIRQRGMHYIQKPFSPETLAKKVRDILADRDDIEARSAT